MKSVDLNWFVFVTAICLGMWSHFRMWIGGVYSSPTEAGGGSTVQASGGHCLWRQPCDCSHSW